MVNWKSGLTLTQQVPIVADNIVQTVIMGMESHNQHASVGFALCDSGRVKECVSVGPSSLDSSSLHKFDGVTSLNEVHGHLLVQIEIDYAGANPPDCQKLSAWHTVFAFCWVCRAVTQIHVRVWGFTVKGGLELAIVK